METDDACSIGEHPIRKDIDECPCGSLLPASRCCQAERRPVGLQKMLQPSKFSCLPTAFCMVMSLDPGLILETLGHDDVRGFHVQELLSLGIKQGHYFVPFETSPDLDRPMCPECDGSRGFGKYQPNADFVLIQCKECKGSGEAPLPKLYTIELSSLMENHDGVLLGHHKSTPDKNHAVAWCSETQKCLDPEGGIYDIEQFEVDIFWLCKGV